MQFAYVSLDKSLAAVAESVRDCAFQGYAIEERFGLNLGGGQYFRIHRGEEEIILCKPYYEPAPSQEFNYCFYFRPASADSLERVVAALNAQGITCQIGPNDEEQEN